MDPEVTSEDPDPRAPIVDGATFSLVAEMELRQAIRLQYYVSLLVLQADVDQPWRPIDGTMLHRLIAEVVRDQIRSTDVLSVTPTPPYTQILLVSAYLDNLPVIIERIAAAVNGRAFETQGGSAHVTLSMGGACFPTTAHVRAELFHQAVSLSAEARGERGVLGHRYRLARRRM
jgi:hypothetical protein